MSAVADAGHRSGPLQFGVFVPQGWKLEYTGWTGPDAWARSVELARLAEYLGYDHLWVYDHVETVPRREPTHVFEAYTMLAALSQRTTRVGLGQLVTCASYRNAGLLAKEAACIDVYSGGRLILGLGAGWFHEEYALLRLRVPVRSGAAGRPRRDPRGGPAAVDRGDGHLRRRPPALRRRLLRPQARPAAAAGAGRRWRRAGQPAHRRPPGRRSPTGRSASRPSSASPACSARYCEEIGRPFDDDHPDPRPGLPPLRHRRRDPGLVRVGRRREPVGPACPPTATWPTTWWAPVEQVTEKTQAFVDAGCRGLILWLRDFPGDETLRRFMAEVVPALEVPSGR